MRATAAFQIASLPPRRPAGTPLTADEARSVSGGAPEAAPAADVRSGGRVSPLSLLDPRRLSGRRSA